MKKLICLPALILLITCVTHGASTQNEPQRLNDQQMRDLVSRMEHDAERFRHSLHEEMEHARWDDKRDRESMNQAANDFEQATGRLKDHFHNGNARPSDVQEVLNRGAMINTYIVGRNMLPRSKTDWVALRGDLDQLASAYNINWQWPQAPPPGQ
ncbi:MAG TPA: hypothetical protein VI756_16710 [Blastocatellia bacterium]